MGFLRGTCGFRGGSVTVPKSSRSVFRNEAGQRFRFQAGHFWPVVGTLTSIISERFPQGKGRWTTPRALGFHWKVEEPTLPTKRLSMRKIKEVLRLRFELGLGQRQIARSCSIGHGTLYEYLKRAQAAGVGWPLPEGWDDRQLEEALFGPTPPRKTERRNAKSERIIANPGVSFPPSSD